MSSEILSYAKVLAKRAPATTTMALETSPDFPVLSLADYSATSRSIAISTILSLYEDSADDPSYYASPASPRVSKRMIVNMDFLYEDSADNPRYYDSPLCPLSDCVSNRMLLSSECLDRLLASEEMYQQPLLDSEVDEPVSDIPVPSVIFDVEAPSTRERPEGLLFGFPKEEADETLPSTSSAESQLSEVVTEKNDILPQVPPTEDQSSPVVFTIARPQISKRTQALIFGNFPIPPEEEQIQVPNNEPEIEPPTMIADQETSPGLNFKVAPPSTKTRPKSLVFAAPEEVPEETSLIEPITEGKTVELASHEDDLVLETRSNIDESWPVVFMIPRPLIGPTTRALEFGPVRDDEQGKNLNHELESKLPSPVAHGLQEVGLWEPTILGTIDEDDEVGTVSCGLPDTKPFDPALLPNFLTFDQDTKVTSTDKARNVDIEDPNCLPSLEHEAGSPQSLPFKDRSEEELVGPSMVKDGNRIDLKPALIKNNNQDTNIIQPALEKSPESCEPTPEMIIKSEAIPPPFNAAMLPNFLNTFGIQEISTEAIAELETTDKPLNEAMLPYFVNNMEVSSISTGLPKNDTSEHEYPVLAINKDSKCEIQDATFVPFSVTEVRSTQLEEEAKLHKSSETASQEEEMDYDVSNLEINDEDQDVLTEALVQPEAMVEPVDPALLAAAQDTMEVTGIETEALVATNPNYQNIENDAPEIVLIGGAISQIDEGEMLVSPCRGMHNRIPPLATCLTYCAVAIYMAVMLVVSLATLTKKNKVLLENAMSYLWSNPWLFVLVLVTGTERMLLYSMITLGFVLMK
jgi:hypothetical protein